LYRDNISALLEGGFNNMLKNWRRHADLPHCSAHGVRDASATEMVDACISKLARKK
jgi:hypothetical protein